MSGETKRFGEWQVSREGQVTLPARRISIAPDRLTESDLYEAIYDRFKHEPRLVCDFIPALREAKRLKGLRGDE